MINGLFVASAVYIVCWPGCLTGLPLRGVFTANLHRLLGQSSMRRGGLDSSLDLVSDRTGSDSGTAFEGICRGVQRHVGISATSKASKEKENKKTAEVSNRSNFISHRVLRTAGWLCASFQCYLFLVKKASLGFLGLGAFPDHQPLLWRGLAGDRLRSSQLSHSIVAKLEKKVGEGHGRNEDLMK